jgi:DNA invertase Pin-like site-specific DNA recombinase
VAARPAWPILPDLIATVNELAGRGIAFESVTEAIDTTTASGKLVFNIFASLADFERHLIGERTWPASPRARPRPYGRTPPPSLPGSSAKPGCC